MADDSRSGGDLIILEERTLVAVPRGDEELRFTFTRARTAAGKDVAWHSLRVFWKGAGGEWKPGKSGVTVRGRELHPVAQAFARAVSGAVQAAPEQAATERRELLPDEEYRRRRGHVTR